MTDVKRQLDEVCGYIELAMWKEAQVVLDGVSPDARGLPETLVLRVEICREMEEWELMAEISLHLLTLQPDHGRHWLNHAAALRYTEGIPPTRNFLARAVKKFPKDGNLLYALACHEAEMGEIDLAREHLFAALHFEPGLRDAAAIDPELSLLL